MKHRKKFLLVHSKTLTRRRKKKQEVGNNLGGCLLILSLNSASYPVQWPYVITKMIYSLVNLSRDKREIM